jgi:hypothetical protein
MSDRWDAALAVDTPPDGSEIPAWLNALESPDLPSPTMVQGPTVANGSLTYGLVARITLNRPGFGFRVEHDLPAGVELIEARPRATVVGDHLIWQLGRVDPGQEVRLEVVVQPEPGLSIDPAEMANFTATYSQNLYFQAPVVRPRLAARISGPATVEVGSAVEFIFDIMNTGNWVVTDGRATVTLPPEFAHPDGQKFLFDLGSMKPGEYRRVTVPAQAKSPGTAVVRAEISGPADHQALVEFSSQVTDL